MENVEWTGRERWGYESRGAKLTRGRARGGVVDGRAVAGSLRVASQAAGSILVVVEDGVVVTGVVVLAGHDARGHRRGDSKKTGLHGGRMHTSRMELNWRR